ncbi:MAG: SusC/RagA family TonB-linked outer membrane protein [Candidatus Pedobacter colombiensis]|uniref:SusC/RagA family TonB-linked outer membrane protein n=1 Tax=Candidatus Pedobacter colombiensis TaxID=3121371 RepID=A0AAJ6B8T6_9SPHI|nr:SusC/RagA family TonB-linked outer membrane protein [Pedobacter sp.]WEK21735.1 MAG: SusC/RagA family TonB-linked outer membrane protein [Pedobacter sp.]
MVFAQSRNIKGIIRDAITAEPLIGATVVVSNTKNGATSNVEGKFQIVLPLEAAVIKCAYVGYKDTMITVNPGIEHIEILLQPSLQYLQDIVVTGYTRQSRSKLTGAISKVDGAAVSAAPVASLDQALQGRVPGLYVASASGLPGTPGRVTIRGIASLQGGNTDPLYIVDGVPVEAASVSALNPEDFESYSVLKDAASTAQYGSRAANGVIVITTKKGKPGIDGRTQVNYQNQFGFSKVDQSRWNMMNSAQRLQFEEILQDPAFPGWQYSRKNDKNADGSSKTESDFAYGDEVLNTLRGSNNELNKKILRSAFTQSHNLDVSGGSEKTTYYLSGGYFQQEGVLHNSGLDRYNLRSNIQHINGRLKLGLNIGLGYVNSRVTEGDFDVSETNPVAAMYFSLPYESLYNKDGSLATGTNKYGANALSMYSDINRKQNRLKGLISTNISYQIAPGLNATGTFGVDYQQENHIAYIRPDSYLGSLVDPGGQGSYHNEYLNNLGLIATGGLMYNKAWGRHDIEVNLLAEINQKNYSSSGFTGYGLIPGLENTPAGITQGTAENSFIPIISGGRSQNRLISQIGIFRYSYADKYTFTASLRGDGTSRAPEANRNRLFYALGAGWNMSKEAFMEDVKAISSLRLRASYGRTGNASGFASDFGYRGLYGGGNYGGMPALIPVYPNNPAYNWELNDIADIGVEFGLFKDRLRGGIDVYNRITSNLFLNKRLSYTSGFETMATNSGRIRNSGVELFLEGDVIKQRDFSFTAGLNLGYNRNRILNLGAEDELVTDDYSINKVGMPLGQFYMVRWAGVDPQTGSPLYLDAEGNKTTTFNPDDAVPVKGSFDPPLKGGLTLNLRYKKLELSSLFTFIKGMYRLNTAELFRTSADANYRQYNQAVDMLNIWQKPGDITDQPGAMYPRYMTDRELQNADYIKLRNIRLGYTFGDSKKPNGSIRIFKVFVQGQNLYTWTKFKAFDPEDDNNWYQYEYPLPRILTAGFNLSF